MRRNSIRLSRRHQAWLYTTFGALFVSGGVWLVFHNYVHVEGQFGETRHPLEPWSLRAHGAAAMVFLIVMGTLLPGHIRRGWNARKNRLTGVVFLVLNGILILSGYALYYFGGENVRPVASALHWIFGFTFPAVLTWHIVQGRRSNTPDDRPTP